MSYKYRIKTYVLLRYQTHSMVYSTRVLQCVLTIFMLEDVLHIVVGHNTKYKIDEFIDKLLISQKFDELAEKIADKAVAKILNLQPSLRITDSSTIDENTQIIQDKARQNETQENVSQNIEEKETSKNISANETDENIQTKSTSRKRLSLKYVHFTKGPPHSKSSEEDSDLKSKKRDTSSDVSTETQNKSHSKKAKDKADTDTDKNKIEIINAEITDSQKLREKSHDENDDGTNYSNENDGSISLENKKNILETLIESGSDDHKSNSDLHKYGDQSEFETKMDRDRHLFQNDYQESSKQSKSKKKRKKRIHKEGKRLYTFVSSSDYDDYHRALDKEEKERTVFG